MAPAELVEDHKGISLSTDLNHRRANVSKALERKQSNKKIMKPKKVSVRKLVGLLDNNAAEDSCRDRRA